MRCQKGSVSKYRTRLIADVVTGKLDVRMAAAMLPDEVEVLESLDEIDDSVEIEDMDAVADVVGKGSVVRLAVCIQQK